MSAHTKNYRLDIQSLRAIAVLSVVLFHINPTFLPGGYIGVDIFFVISGYLILGFIWRDLKNKSFSLLDFYTKRVYRLFPALFVTVCVSSIAAYFILLPHESEIYVKSMVSTLFYVSNFYFYTQADYFNDAMAFYPLLHTWSLSVEEQFYMLFPLILMFIYRHKMKYIFTVLLLLGIVSLMLSQWYVNQDASFAFFSSPTRFFQFIMCGLIAINLQGDTTVKKGNDIAIVAGLGMVFYTLYFYSEKTLFPGINALLPTVGVGLVLYFGTDARYTKQFLENRVLGFIGNASYSIYLWHWPLLVFYKLKYSPNLSLKEQFGLLIVSLCIGIFSWYFIENRFRKDKFSTRTLKPIVTVLGMSFLFVLSSILIFTYFPSKTLRYQQKAAQYLTFNTDEFRAGSCFLTSKYNDVKFYDKDLCVTYKKGKKNYLLLGDSHAAHYYAALSSMMHSDETLTQVTASGCVPLLNTKGARRCTGLNDWAYKTLVSHKHFNVIILSANWRIVNKKAFDHSLKQLAKYTDKLIVFGPSLEYKQSLPRLLLGLKKGEESSQLYKTASAYDTFVRIDKHIGQYTKSNGIAYISILKVLCDKSGCKSITEDGTPINFDNGHLTHEGAAYILKSIEDKIFDR